MIEPHAQYAITEDGVSIAYVVVGSGAPLLYLQPHTHALRAWDIPEIREWYTRLAQRHRLVHLDIRHTGLSQRDAGPITIDTCISDIEAVVRRLGLQRFALMAMGGLASSAAAYAIRHPDQVEKLVLWAPAARGGAMSGREQRNRSTETIFDQDPDLGFELHTRFMFGEQPPPRVDQQEFIRAAVRAEDMHAYATYYREMDIAAQLPQVLAQTLVVHPGRDKFMPGALMERVARAIPNCEFVDLDAELYPFRGPDQDNNMRVVETFLAGGTDWAAGRARPADASLPGKVALSIREHEVLRMVAEGRTSREIAAQLVLSERTVARHVANVYMKIGVHNRAQATAYAFETGVL